MGLADSGRPLLAHALERCLASRRAARVIAAVDGPELAAVARAAGAEAVLTDPDLPSGSDRVWAAVQSLPEARWIVNVQGDEPEIDPAAIDALFEALAGGAEVATLAAPWPEGSDPADPAAVKVVRAGDGRALYFSRAPIPFRRQAGAAGPSLHLGVYAYTREALAAFASSPPTPLERTEGLEQLRFLERGTPIQVLSWPFAFPGVDTRADYDAFLQRQKLGT
ncbi:MAG: 3-deoxy-manno-octulosonate cytidylyltransferase [Planctomycetes bacterium]|nr:3-deoxy-manno-octulosonate cytidylyltransferase [Planctomycetota bacterium]